MKLLFQQCKIAMESAVVLSDMLAHAKPEEIKGRPILVRVISQLTSAFILSVCNITLR
jgi:hypothetical protein